MKESEPRKPSFSFSLVVFLCIIVIMVAGLTKLGGSLCMVLLISWFAVFIAGKLLGYKFTDLEQMAYTSIGSGMGPIMIVMTVRPRQFCQSSRIAVMILMPAMLIST